MERHDPLTCELCHGEGVSAELVSLRAENERLREALTDALGEIRGRVWTIGRSSIYEPQINVEAVKRWESALASDDKWLVYRLGPNDERRL